MQQRYFTAIIEAGGKSGYGVYFPDLPGCVSAGDTIEEAARNAEEALSLHLRGIVEDGEDIPAATVPEKTFRRRPSRRKSAPRPARPKSPVSSFAAKRRAERSASISVSTKPSSPRSTAPPRHAR